jgi:hypothetical protein
MEDRETPRSVQCGECKAALDTRHLDGCSWQYSEEWVSEQAARTGSGE